jgi:hypothetical protein
MKPLIIGGLMGSLLFISSCNSQHKEHEFILKEIPKPVLGPQPEDDGPGTASDDAVESESNTESEKNS